MNTITVLAGIFI